ncbi:hypothetical protein GCM10007857_43350 [Bradyrhizobium iriomotense]|uniref:Uncharacterized protein n=1 Tax=Bradyrhizobium iriomotense TaxID=441950 RepID=A0ABQ6AZL1_9BRAD|nr:hypothetical protein GCM10007857_43350 [Bradyrhizobium iriomotense]
MAAARILCLAGAGKRAIEAAPFVVPIIGFPGETTGSGRICHSDSGSSIMQRKGPRGELEARA